MRVLVTGSRGFVGTWLTAHLAEIGDEAVELPEDLDIGDRDRLVPVVQEAGAGAICHLAAQAAVGRASAEEMPIGEDQPLAPSTPYAASKAAAEMVGLQAWLGHGLEVVRARPFNHVGSGQGPGFVVPDFALQVAKAARGELDRIATGNLGARRDITDVRDVVRAYRLLMAKGEPGGVYNVCRGEAVAVSDLLRRLMELAGVDVPVWTDPALLRPADVPAHVGDAGRLRARCGWAPEVPLERTLGDILARLGQIGSPA